MTTVSMPSRRDRHRAARRRLGVGLARLPDRATLAGALDADAHVGVPDVVLDCGGRCVGGRRDCGSLVGLKHGSVGARTEDAHRDDRVRDLLLDGRRGGLRGTRVRDRGVVVGSSSTAALLVAVDWLTWLTAPSSPGLPTRTETCTLPTSVCVALALASAAWATDALPPVPTLALAVASAAALAWFAWVTPACVPGSSMRTALEALPLPFPCP